jgi:hypothetical protein
MFIWSDKDSRFTEDSETLADGTVTYGSQANMFGSQRDINGNLRSTVDIESGKNTDRGRWSSSGGILTLQWEDGSIGRFAYGIEQNGNRLVFRNPQTKKLIDFYQRVQ